MKRFQIATSPTVSVWFSWNLAHITYVAIRRKHSGTEFWNFDFTFVANLLHFNNNNNNIQDNVHGAVVMTELLWEFTQFIWWMWNGAKPDDLGCESACTGCQNLHPPLSFIIITQPESCCSFYHPTESRRLSQSSWLVTYRDGLPVHRRSPILVLTGSDVAQLRWSRPTRYH